jgi:hypothetical protein
MYRMDDCGAEYMESSRIFSCVIEQSVEVSTIRMAKESGK